MLVSHFNGIITTIIFNGIITNGIITPRPPRSNGKNSFVQTRQKFGVNLDGAHRYREARDGAKFFRVTMLVIGIGRAKHTRFVCSAR